MCIGYLVSEHVHLGTNPVRVLGQFGKIITTTLIDNEAEYVEEYKGLTRGTLPFFYKTLFLELIAQTSHLKSMEASQKQALKLVQDISQIFQTYIEFAKTFPDRPVLLIALRQGRTFVDTFLKTGLVILNEWLLRDKAAVQGIFKTFQDGTRGLQVGYVANVC